MRGWLKRRRRSRQHPTPQQAFDALSQARCMYAPISNCSGPPAPAGLNGDWDERDVLVCRAHYGRLRKIDARTAAKLERHLRKAFSKQKPSASAGPEQAEGVLLVMGVFPAMTSTAVRTREGVGAAPAAMGSHP